MDLREYFSDSRRGLTATIADYFGRPSLSAPRLRGGPEAVAAELADYASSGKMLRGILARLGADLFSDWPGGSPPPLSPRLAKLGAALELFQAGLLAHDDIMDQDDFRRGKPTLHRRFEAEGRARAQGPTSANPSPAAESGAKRGQTIDFGKLGESWAICAGDLFFFAAYSLLAESAVKAEVETGASPASATTDVPEVPDVPTTTPDEKSFGQASSLFARCSQELVDVCLAQAADVGYGSFEVLPSLDEVLDVYEYKTARYTIALPLFAGALLAGASEAIPALEALAKPLGIVFQLQDDRLGLFGDEEKLGKPIGSDIREGKKTPYILLLAPRLAGEERRRFEKAFGDRNLDREDLAYVRGLVTKHGVDAEVEALAGRLRLQALAALAELPKACADAGRPATPSAVRLLADFVEYAVDREN